jgi:hypothetical protein
MNHWQVELCVRDRKNYGKYMRQSLEKWWQLHGVRVWKGGDKHMASESGKVVTSTWRQSL